MSLLELLPPLGFEKNNSQSIQAPSVPPVEQLPSFGQSEEVDLMPLDLRSGELAALAVTRYGASILVEHDYPPDRAERIVSETARYLGDMGLRAANAFDTHRTRKAVNGRYVKRLHQNVWEVEYSEVDKVGPTPKERFDMLAEQYAIEGDGAALVLHSLRRLATTDDMLTSPFDKATAAHLLQNVSPDKKHIRV